MKLLYLLLFVLIACGFFACTTELGQPEVTELQPTPAGKKLDARAFAEFTDLFVTFGIFDAETYRDSDHFGVMDVRLQINETADLSLGFLMNDGFLSVTDHDDVRAAAPERPWATAIRLGFDDGQAERLHDWLTAHFTDAPFVDLRIIALPGDKLTLRALVPTVAERLAFPASPL